MSNSPVSIKALLVGLTGLVIVAVGAVPALANRPQTKTVCTWGGTPAAPSGTFQLNPGLTNTPAAGPLHLVATGDLAQAAVLESLIMLTSTLDRGELGPFFYRFNRPGELSAT